MLHFNLIILHLMSGQSWELKGKLHVPKAVIKSKLHYILLLQGECVTGTISKCHLYLIPMELLPLVEHGVYFLISQQMLEIDSSQMSLSQLIQCCKHTILC